MFEYVLEALPEFSMESVILDGGVVQSRIICQTLADLTGVPTMRPETEEATALGMAILAALHLGWTTLEEVTRCHVKETNLPNKNTNKIKPSYRTWLKAMERSKDWLD